jgi:PAS domain S-box-containing protein
MDQTNKTTVKTIKNITLESIIIFSVGVIFFFLISYFGLFGYITRYANEQPGSFINEIIAGIMVLALCFSVLGYRRWKQLRQELPLREKSERALKISEERFKSLINSLDDVVFTLDRRQRYTAVYGRWLSGHEKLHPDEFIGKTARELFGPKEGAIHERSINKALDGQSVSYEWSIKTNGDKHHFQIAVSPLRDEESNIIGVVGVGHDITDKKEYERELHRHEQELRVLLENTPDVIVRYDRRERYVYVNRAFESVMGCTRNQVVGKKQSELSMPKELSPFWYNSIGTVFQTGIGTTLEAEVPTPTGIKYYQASLVPELNAENVVDYVLVVARDLTKHKRTEDNLRSSEEQLERILQTTPGGVTIIDLNGRIYFANQTAEQILGLKRKTSKERYYKDPTYKITTIEGKPIHEKDLPYIQVMMTGEPVYGLEHIIEQPDGQQIVLSINAAPLHDYNNKVSAIITSITDITKLKHAEAEARRNEQRFRDLANSISDVFFAMDTDLRCTYWNHASEKLTGIPPRKAIAHQITDLLPRSMTDELYKLFTESIKTQVTKTHVSNVKFNGKTYYFDINIYPAKHGLSVFFRDVSERMYAERERERLITELQDALNKVKTLSGLLPICAFCKNIRDDGGYWHQVESYIKKHSEANFSHGVCPDCAKKHYPEYFKEPNDNDQ